MAAQLGAYSQKQQNMPNSANLPSLANMNLPSPGNSIPFTETIEYKYKRTQNNCQNNVCNFGEESRALTGTFDLETDGRGGSVAGGTGKATINTLRFDKYTNEKCAKTGRQTLEGNMDVSSSAGGRALSAGYASISRATTSPQNVTTLPSVHQNRFTRNGITLASAANATSPRRI
jgi:hypothetical protein